VNAFIGFYLRFKSLLFPNPKSQIPNPAFMRCIYPIVDRIALIYHKNYRLIFLLLLLALTAFAWFNRFVQDDAFISFRYAEHLAQGKGLVWNDGYRIEGFSNFLWTVIIAAGIFFSAEPVVFSQIMGLVFFLITLLTIYKISQFVFKSSDLALLIIFLTGVNYTFSCYATGGLETMLQTCLFAFSIYLSFLVCSRPEKNYLYLFILSVALALSLMIRLDSAIIVPVVFVFLVYCCFKSPCPAKKKIVSLLLFSLPLILIIGFWLYWKWKYFGDILPNTYYLKAAHTNYVLYGLKYIYMFIISNLLIPFPVLFFFGLPKILPAFNRKWYFLLGVVTLWLAYIIKIGGDFMEFRFFVPILPFLVILYIWLILKVVIQRFIRTTLIFLIVIGSFHHQFTFGKITFITEIASITELTHQVEAPDISWADVGKILGRDLNYSSNITIAVTAAGAIPFYSKLRTVDMLGLSDKWIALNGVPYRDKPGHRKITTLRHLLEENVNLIIAHPQIIGKDESTPAVFPLTAFNRFRVPLKNPHEIPPNASLLEIPLKNGYRLLAFYLIPHPEIESALLKSHWKKIPCVR